MRKIRCALVLLVLMAASAFAQQTTKPTRPAPRTDFEVVVPSGWTLDNSASNFVRVRHAADGAVLQLRGVDPSASLDEIARSGADRTAYPLGFARISEPRHMQGEDGIYVEYEIRGARLSDRRRILYRVGERDGYVIETIYENGEERFAALQGEAERIAASLVIPALALERLALSDIRSIASAENAFFGAKQRFVSLTDLIESGGLDSRFRATMEGYRFTIRLEDDDFRVEAAPLSGGAYGYQTDKSEVVRYSDNPVLAPKGMAGKPIR